MAWSNYQLILAGMMVVTGSINTLSTKWADKQRALGSVNVHLFVHPFLQAVGMFIGESMCLVMYGISHCIKKKYSYTYEKSPKLNPFVFLPAALLDMCATSMLYIGLNMTFASSFQMLRGAVIIFTALLSVGFLRRQIKPRMWGGIVLVMIGLALVGIADIIFSKEKVDRNGVIAGDLLIVAAQVVVATQMVYEEKVVNKLNVPPLKAVGLEGLFGMLILGVLLIPFYYIDGGTFFHTNPNNRVEDPLDAFTQMKNNHIIIIATVGNIISIAFFNFSGISVTKEISATTRMVLDSLRTVVIWVVSMGVGWQHFQYLQLIGFLILLIGMCFYYNVIILPFINKFILRKHEGEELTLPPSMEYSYDVDDSKPLLPDVTVKSNNGSIQMDDD